MKGIRSAPIPMVAALAWLVVMASAWLSVGSQSWAQTLLLAAVGGLYLLFPPATFLPRSFIVLIGLLLLLGTTAFMPGDWLGASFRSQFKDHGIILPWTLSAQPWRSLEDLTLLLTTMLWAWICFENGLSVEQR